MPAPDLHIKKAVSAVAKTPPPPGKVWEFGVLSHRVPFSGKNYVQSIRFICRGAKIKFDMGMLSYEDDALTLSGTD